MNTNRFQKTTNFLTLLILSAVLCCGLTACKGDDDFKNVFISVGNSDPYATTKVFGCFNESTDSAFEADFSWNGTLQKGSAAYVSVRCNDPENIIEISIRIDNELVYHEFCSGDFDSPHFEI